MATKAKKVRPAKLNAQGLARRSPEIMECILPDEGQIAVSIDLGRGEPTVSTHFSNDVNYRAACFDMVGKAPYYDNGILQIDDLYLMVMSVSPVGRDKIKQAWNRKWPEGTFAEQWVVSPEVITKEYKKERQLHKILALALSYGMSPKKMVKTAYENGYNLSMKEAKAFYEVYWHLFSGIRSLADRLAKVAERDTYITNIFGYRLKPEPRKAFNYLIQSSVSGIMHVFTAKLAHLAPYATWVTCVHDELIMHLDINMLDKFKEHVQQATDSLNEDLQWSVAIRTGFAPGDSWYTAK